MQCCYFGSKDKERNVTVTRLESQKTKRRLKKNFEEKNQTNLLSRFTLLQLQPSNVRKYLSRHYVLSLHKKFNPGS